VVIELGLSRFVLDGEGVGEGVGVMVVPVGLEALAGDWGFDGTSVNGGTVDAGFVAAGVSMVVTAELLPVDAQ
jgi:hypothetical protein